MILGFDIGNTSTTAGIYADKEITPAFTFRYPTIKNIAPAELCDCVIDGISEYQARHPGTDISGLAFSSVAPEVNRSYSEMAEKIFGVVACEISYKSRLNIKIIYDNPAELGVDRIVNAAAAFHEYGGGVIIVDIGTAVTFCVLLDYGVFDGGVIAPGIDTAIKSLAARASQLPEVPFEKPERLVARDTVNALKSGFFYGWISLAEGIIGGIQREYGRDFRIILTGGFASAVTGHLAYPNIADQLLSMKGIKLVYDLNL